MGRAKKLQDQIEALRREIQDVRPTNAFSVAVIAQKQADMYVYASQIAELSTGRIVRLTWGLFILTVALLVVSVTQLVQSI